MGWCIASFYLFIFLLISNDRKQNVNSDDIYQMKTNSVRLCGTEQYLQPYDRVPTAALNLLSGALRPLNISLAPTQKMEAVLKG